MDYSAPAPQSWISGSGHEREEWWVDRVKAWEGKWVNDARTDADQMKSNKS